MKYRDRFIISRRLASLVVSTTLGASLVAQTSVDDSETVVLSPFEVQSTLATGEAYASPQSNAGTILAKDREKIPMPTTVLTEDFLRDLKLDNTEQLASVVSGLGASGNSNTFNADVGGVGGRNLSYQVRGFTNEPLFNGFQTGALVRNSDNIGRIEVIKSPNSVLYGQGSAGGIIDIATKAPILGRSFGSVMAGIGASDSSSKSNSTHARIDVNAPWGKNAALRIVPSYQEWDREQYFFESEVFGLGAGLKATFGRKVTLDVASELTRLKSVPSRTAAFVSVGSGPNRVIDAYNRLRNDRNFSHNGPHSSTNRTTNINSAYLTFLPTEALTIRAGMLYGGQWSDGLEYATNLSLSETDNNAFYFDSEQTNHTRGQKIDVVYQTKLFGWSVDSLIGWERNQQDSAFLRLRSDTTRFPTPITIPFSRRALYSDYPLPPPPQAFSITNTNSLSELEWTNIRFSQFIESEGGRTSFMWGFARGEGSNQSFNLNNGTSSKSEGDDVTYTVGATHRIFEGDTSSFTLFANHSTSFVIQGGNQQNPNQFNGFTSVAALRAYIDSLAPNPVEPQLGEGFEAGVRATLLDKRVSISVAYFDQTRENIARNFFVRQSLVPGETSELALATYQLAAGEENAKGFDIETTWQITPYLSLRAGGTFMDGEVVENPESPEEVGFGLVSAPETTYNWWLIYNAPKASRLSGFTAGIGASYASSSRIRPEVPDRYRVSDAYTNARLLLRYTIQGERFRQEFAVNVENLLDEEYTQEGNWLSEPRRIKFSYTIGY